MKRPMLCAILVFVVVLATSAEAPAQQWQEVTVSAAPQARFGHTLTTVGAEVYLFGGNDRSNLHNDLWRWDHSAQTWVELTAANPPPARYYHGAAESGGALFVGYGTGAGGVLGDLWRYDPDANAWTEIAVSDGPAAHSRGAMAALGDAVFVCGGQGSNPSNPGPPKSATLIDLGQAAGSATAAATALASLSRGRYGLLAAYSAGNPTVIAGYDIASSGTTTAILTWNPNPPPRGSWNTVTPGGSTPEGRVQAAVARWWATGDGGAIGEHLWILGGETDSSFTSRTVQYYNTLTNIWIDRGETLPTTASSAAAAAIPPLTGGGTASLELLFFGGITTGNQPLGATLIGTTDLEVSSGVIYWTEIAANLEGNFGSVWRTDVVARNTGDSDATVDFILHTDSGSETVSNTIAPSAQGVFEDIVGTMGVSDKGALEVQSSQPLQVSSRIYNQGDQGTFGQFVGSSTAGGGMAAGDSGWLLQLRQLSDTFRTNISVTNTGAEAASVRITLYRTDGTAVHTYTLDVAPGVLEQDSQPFNYRAGEPDLGWGFAQVEVLSGDGILASASVVDSVTNDATTVPIKR